MSNNTIELTGYPTREAQYIDKTKTPFLAFGFATQESYKDQNEQWQQTKPAFHDIILFKEDLIERNKDLTTKDRLKITGCLNYEFIKAQTQDGKEATFKKATVIAKKIESAAFIQKDEPVPETQ